MYPSIKTIMQIKDVTRTDAIHIRMIMKGNAPKVCGGCRGDMSSGQRGDGVTPTGSWRPCSYYTDGQCRYSRMKRIDTILRTFGVEYIPAGSNRRSPAIYYCNTGDSYDLTILKVNGRFRVGCWGDIVERGNYA